MVKLSLNQWQRATIIAVAVLILLILYAQIEDEGLEDSPWLVSILVVGALLFLAATPGRASEQVPPRPTPEAFAKNTKDEGPDAVRERLVSASRQWTDFLKGSFADRMPSLPRAMKDDFSGHIETNGIRLAYGVYLLVISRRYPDASNGPDARALKVAAGGLLSRAIHSELQEMGHPEGAREKALEAAVREITEVQRIIARVMDGFRTNSPFPMDPLWLSVEEQFPLGLKTAADRETFFGIKLRQEIGRLLM